MDSDRSLSRSSSLRGFSDESGEEAPPAQRAKNYSLSGKKKQSAAKKRPFPRALSKGGSPIPRPISFPQIAEDFLPHEELEAKHILETLHLRFHRVQPVQCRSTPVSPVPLTRRSKVVNLTPHATSSRVKVRKIPSFQGRKVTETALFGRMFIPVHCDSNRHLPVTPLRGLPHPRPLRRKCP